MKANLRDIFAEAREAYSILDAWVMLRLPGEPKPGMNRSPWREDNHPSLSIFEGGKGWNDHGSGEGGDVVSFIACALTGNCKGYSEARDWLLERLGIDHGERPTRRTVAAPRIAPEPSEPEWTPIQWPSDLLTGKPKTWEVFGKLRGYAYPTVHVAVHADLLRFCKIDDHKCYVITDATHRAAEIRRIDGKPFGNGRKAFPLSGVSKAWLPGFELWDREIPRDFLITEGATDFLAALNLVTRSERGGGMNRWLPMACLGASITSFAPEILRAMQGRRVLLVPDGDDAGRRWRNAVAPKLQAAGAIVDSVLLPEGEDLSSVAAELKPEGLCDAFADDRN